MKFTQRRRKKPEFVCPDDATIVRHFRHRMWGDLPVVAFTVPITEKRMVLDADGKQVIRKTGPRREIETPMAENVKIGTETVEKLWLPINETIAHWVTGWEQSAEELAAVARREKIAATLEELATEIVDSGQDAKTFVQSRVRAVADANATDAMPAEEGPKKLGGGWWQMPDGSRFRGSKEAAERHLNTEYGGVVT